MKLQCVVCGVDEASVLCCADEAALCCRCDGRVHSANKVAGKHRRISLLRHTSPKTFPLCDICKEKRGFVFYQEDRAILCLDCDPSVHSANAHTVKHSRFLLTGIMLSAAYSASSPPPSGVELVSSSITGNSRASEEDTLSGCRSTTSTEAKDNRDGGISISEYLLKMLPEWRVDDFFFDDTDTASNWAGCDLMRVAAVVAGSSTGSSPWTGSAAAAMMEDVPIWVPALPALQLYAREEERTEMGWVGSGWRKEISMVPHFQCRKKK